MLLRLRTGTASVKEHTKDGFRRGVAEEVTDDWTPDKLKDASSWVISKPFIIEASLATLPVSHGNDCSPKTMRSYMKSGYWPA